MKRYIKSSINIPLSIADWIELHKDDHLSHITIVDTTPYPEAEYDELLEGYDCPGVIFEGTYEDLLNGTGDENYMEYGLPETMEYNSKYFIVEDRIEEFNGVPYHYIVVDQ